MSNAAKNLNAGQQQNSGQQQRVSADQIKPHMPVVCSNDGQFAEVDHIEGSDTIKLKKDDSGKHHYIPVSWVTSVEGGKVKVDRPGDQAMKQWSSEAPKAR